MLLSRREYAKHRGVDDKAVRNAIATGRITTINDMIDPEMPISSGMKIHITNMHHVDT